MPGDSSVDLLIQVNQSERQAQLAHFDSLASKAGLVLGFAGVLIALGNSTSSLLGVLSVAGAAGAAVAAAASFWPRGFPSIDASRLGDYETSELAFTQLTLLDTLEVITRHPERLTDQRLSGDQRSGSKTGQGKRFTERGDLDKGLMPIRFGKQLVWNTIGKRIVGFIQHQGDPMIPTEIKKLPDRRSRELMSGRIARSHHQ